VVFGTNITTLRRNILPRFSGFKNNEPNETNKQETKRQTVCSSKIATNFYWTARRHIPDMSSFHRQNCVNLRSQGCSIVCVGTAQRFRMCWILVCSPILNGKMRCNGDAIGSYSEGCSSHPGLGSC
jgi:hypothetical protein